MPISMEQWRASVGSNNAAHSHVLRKFGRKKKSPESLLSQIMSLLVAGLVTSTGK